MLGFSPLVDLPNVDIPDTAPAIQAYYDLIESDTAEHCFIVLVNMISKGDPIGDPTGWSVMEKARMETYPEGADALPTANLLLSDTPWSGKPTDTIFPNTLTDTRLIKPFTMERNLPILPNTSRRGQVSFGQIEFANADGAYDSIINDYSIDGQRIQIYLGPKWGDFSQFNRVGDAFGYRWSAKRDRVRVSVRDVSVQFSNPIHGVTYNGAGGLDGDPELTGTTKPLCFGEVFNITPVRINIAYLIYQIHDGNIQGVTAVRDRGAPLTNSAGDFPDYVSLATASLTPGEYATCNNLGLIRLASSPDGPVTCDVEGDAASGYTTKLGDIVLNILRRYAGVSSSNVLKSSFYGLPQGVAGYYIAAGQNPTVGNVLDDLLGSVGAWYGGTRDRRLRVGTIPIPETAIPQHYVDQYDVIDIQREETPSPPRYKQGTSWGKNWTPMQDSDIATSISGSDADRLGTPSYAFVISAGDVILRFSTAVDGGIVDTYFRDKDDAEDTANYLLNLHKEARQLFKVEFDRQGYKFNLGDMVNLSYPRWGLDSGKNFAVVGLREDASKSKITLRLWG